MHRTTNAMYTVYRNGMLQAECARLRRYYDEQLAVATAKLGELRSQHEARGDELERLLADRRRAEQQSRQLSQRKSQAKAIQRNKSRWASHTLTLTLTLSHTNAPAHAYDEMKGKPSGLCHSFRRCRFFGRATNPLLHDLSFTVARFALDCVRFASHGSTAG